MKTDMQQIHETQNEICQSQIEMMSRFKELLDGHALSPAPPTQSAFSNSGRADDSIPCSSAIKQEDASMYMVNGVNVLHLPAKTPYLFGLQLLDMLFSRAELSSSLLFKSTKSERGVLDPTKVSRIIDIMNKRYNQTEWNMAKFVSKANQKCRDSECDS
eukprot:Em0005g1046a